MTSIVSKAVEAASWDGEDFKLGQKVVAFRSKVSGDWWLVQDGGGEVFAIIYREGHYMVQADIPVPDLDDVFEAEVQRLLRNDLN